MKTITTIAICLLVGIAVRSETEHLRSDGATGRGARVQSDGPMVRSDGPRVLATHLRTVAPSYRTIAPSPPRSVGPYAASFHGAQSASDTADAHVESAKSAAGDVYQNLFNFLCTVLTPRAGGPGPRRGGGPPLGPPERSTWYAEPVKVFDNLYFVGQSEYSAWAVTTTDGIILIDTLFDYSVEEEVAGGLRKLGLDPATIKYSVVTHPHRDHHGGAKFLQDRYRTRIVMSAPDWDVIDRLPGTRPARDMVATDGQTLTLGDTKLTLYITPGHTPGTLSVLIPVRDGGQPHLAALWGGTGLNADRDSLEQYIASARRFDDVAQKAGADIILSNHTDWDRSKINLPRLAKRAPGASNPYVVSPQTVHKYLEVAQECATARLMRLN
jgi:metallo-beta-lactamase class B